MGLNRKHICALATFLAFLGLRCEAKEPERVPVNLGFETGEIGAVPPGWQIPDPAPGVAFHAEITSQTCFEGAQCAKLVRTGSTNGYSVLLQVVSAEEYRGKRLRLRAALRAAIEPGGKALLYLQVNSPNGRTVSQLGQPARSDWREDALVLEVPPDAETLQFGAVESGNVSAWLDAFSVVAAAPKEIDEAPRPLDSTGLANLAALARLIGAVRYFHPSDGAARLDWPTWTIETVRAVEKVRTARQLAAILDTRIRAFAPTVRVLAAARRVATVPPSAGEGARIIFWRHFGLDTGTALSGDRFNSSRIGGYEPPPGVGAVTAYRDALALRGQQVHLALRARMESGEGSSDPRGGTVWIAASDQAGQVIAHTEETVKSGPWSEHELALLVPESSVEISFGGRLEAAGSLFLGQVRVTTGSSAQAEVFRTDFEDTTPGERPSELLLSRRARAAGYLATVEAEQGSAGGRCLRLNWSLGAEIPDPAAPLKLSLGRGISAIVPVALYADREGTLPRSSRALPASRRLSLGPIIPSGDDRGTRLADVLLLWTALDGFYPYWNVLHADWSASLERALRTAAQDKDRRAFLDTLRRLVADLHDDHAVVTQASDDSDHRIPLLWDWIAGRLVVTWVDASIAGLSPGDQIEQVDGRRVRPALAKAESLVSGATPEHRRYRALELLASCADGTERSLVAGRGTSAARKLSVPCTAPRLGPNRLRGARPEKVAELEPDIFYLDFDRIDDSDFEQALPRLIRAHGIVIDMRGYPERISETVAAHLLETPRRSLGQTTEVRIRPDLKPHLSFADDWIEPKLPRITARIAVLVDTRAYSRAESYLGIFAGYSLGKLVGSKSGGTDGEVEEMALPGGYLVYWTGDQVTKLDGSRLQGIGFAPDVRIAPTLEGVSAGRDELLEAAVDQVSGKRSQGDESKSHDHGLVSVDPPRDVQ